MEKLLASLRKDYPGLLFEEGEVASWSWSGQRITYSLNDAESAAWTLLHELGHALCEHQRYSTDVNLVRKEAEAWHKAKQLANTYGVVIDEDYIQDCMDTYRNWLHKRSTCPSCSAHGLQQEKGRYDCPNCQTHWQVGTARFCRPYRLKIAHKT